MIVSSAVKETAMVWLLNMPTLQHLYDSHRVEGRSLRAPPVIMLLIVRFSDMTATGGDNGVSGMARAASIPTSPHA